MDGGMGGKWRKGLRGRGRGRGGWGTLEGRDSHSLKGVAAGHGGCFILGFEAALGLSWNWNLNSTFVLFRRKKPECRRVLHTPARVRNLAFSIYPPVIKKKGLRFSTHRCARSILPIFRFSLFAFCIPSILDYTTPGSSSKRPFPFPLVPLVPLSRS